MEAVPEHAQGGGEAGVRFPAIDGTTKSTKSRRKKKFKHRRGASKGKVKDFKVVTAPRVHHSFEGEPEPPALKQFTGSRSTSWLFQGEKMNPSASLLSLPGGSMDGGSSSPRLDIDAMKAIIYREGLVRKVRDGARMILATSKLGQAIDDQVKNLLDLLLQLRSSTVGAVEAIVAWRWYEAERRAEEAMFASRTSTGRGSKEDPASDDRFPVFEWNKLDYLHKLCNDLDFLAASEPLLAALRISPGMLRANPFMMPQNLADRAVALAQGPAKGALPTPTLAEAEHTLISTSSNPSIRAAGGNRTSLGTAAAAAAISLEDSGMHGTLPPVRRPDSGSGSVASPSRDSAKVANADQRLLAAEVVVLHHLAHKAGDTGLSSRLAGVQEFEADHSGPEYGPDGYGSDEYGSTAEYGEDTADPYAAEPGSGPLGLSNSEVQAIGAEGEDGMPTYDPTATAPAGTEPRDEAAPRTRGVNHSLKKASSIYLDTSDAHAAYVRRERARAAAGAMPAPAPPMSSTTASAPSFSTTKQKPAPSPAQPADQSGAERHGQPRGSGPQKRRTGSRGKSRRSASRRHPSQEPAPGHGTAKKPAGQGHVDGAPQHAADGDEMVLAQMNVRSTTPSDSRRVSEKPSEPARSGTLGKKRRSKLVRKKKGSKPGGPGTQPSAVVTDPQNAQATDPGFDPSGLSEANPSLLASTLEGEKEEDDEEEEEHEGDGAADDETKLSEPDASDSKVAPAADHPSEPAEATDESKLADDDGGGSADESKLEAETQGDEPAQDVFHQSVRRTADGEHVFMTVKSTTTAPTAEVTVRNPRSGQSSRSTIDVAGLGLSLKNPDQVSSLARSLRVRTTNLGEMCAEVSTPTAHPAAAGMGSRPSSAGGFPSSGSATQPAPSGAVVIASHQTGRTIDGQHVLVTTAIVGKDVTIRVFEPKTSSAGSAAAVWPADVAPTGDGPADAAAVAAAVWPHVSVSHDTAASSLRVTIA